MNMEWTNCEHMWKSQNTPPHLPQKLEDFSEQADRYDPDDMSAADSKYYLEVMARCEMKLLDAMG